MTSLFADYNVFVNGIPAPVGLAFVALVGYLVGRLRREKPSTVESRARREVKRAQSVARNLETIATAVRKDLAGHRASLDRFKNRVTELSREHDEEGWRKLCAEAEQMLGPTMALASQIAHAYDQIRQQTNSLMTFTEVRTDPLTGICNRRAMDDTIGSLVAMKNRYDLSFSIVLFDIDYFKKINDERGHLAGDAILKSVAELMDETARETDVVTRYGGEEFVVIMPQTELRGACVFAERMRAKVAEKLEITVSGGVAMAAGGDDDAEQLLERADAAMYAAKQAGRNRVYYHNGLQPEPTPGAAEGDVVEVGSAESTAS